MLLARNKSESLSGYASLAINSLYTTTPPLTDCGCINERYSTSLFCRGDDLEQVIKRLRSTILTNTEPVLWVDGEQNDFYVWEGSRAFAVFHHTFMFIIGYTVPSDFYPAFLSALAELGVKSHDSQ